MSQTHSDITTLEDQFEYDLQAAYDMELKLVDALDDMSQSATNDNISQGFATHRDETEAHVERVEAVFDAIGREPTRRDNYLLDGLLDEKDQYEANVADDDLRNAHYLGAGMKTERIEMTTYESLLTTADKADLGDDVTDPLEDSLDEEEKTFKELKGLSTGSELKSLWNRLTG